MEPTTKSENSPEVALFIKSILMTCLLLFADSTKVGDPENLYQISLLIDHLKHDEVQFREQAARSLALIGETDGAVLIPITHEKRQ